MPDANNTQRPQQCGGCRFWDWTGIFSDVFEDGMPDYSGASGRCHRYPPVWQPSEHSDGTPACWIFPGTFADEWCGEWQQNPTPEDWYPPEGL